MKNLHSTWSATFVALLFFLAVNAFAQPTFINKIPIPPVIDAANGTILLEMQKTFHKFNPGVPNDTLNGGTAQPNGIPTYTYNVPGNTNLTILGPTLKWYTYAQTKIHVTNKIGTPSTTHWHGAELPADMDGGPHQGIMPDSTWTAPDFPVLDSACTMWYHPHYHDATVEHVQRGLSGMIFIEQGDDPIRPTIPRTYGVDDIPIIISDLGVKRNSNGTAWNIDTVMGKRPINLVNGVTNPYVELPAHFVRLRILNGSTRKGLKFGFSESPDSQNPNDLIPMIQIATDGGYTLEPNTMTTLVNGPGARDEILLDLRQYNPGDVLYFRNLTKQLPRYVVGGAAPPGPNAPGGGDVTQGDAFVQIRIVADPPNYTPVNVFTPFSTVWSPALADTSNIARHRTKRLVKIANGGYTIDSLTYHLDVINDIICEGSKEIWTIHNVSNVAHPFHIHKIQFRILDIVDSFGVAIDLKAHGLNGPKDDVLVMPGWKLRFLGHFSDYPTHIEAHHAYMYHCHILTHEDAIGGGMMHQFVVTDDPVCIVSTRNADDLPEMKLFPNPSTGALFLEGQSAKESRVKIVNVQGRLVREQKLPAFEGNVRIDIDGLSHGLYLVEWRTATGTVTGKLVVDR